MTRYTATTDADREAMLAAIGVSSVGELFDRQIPEPVRLRRALDLPAGMPEQEVYEHLRALAARNVDAEQELSFLGGGMYDHYVPALIDMLMERSEFLTPYTPCYQLRGHPPKVARRSCRAPRPRSASLTGLPVANASVYEGASAVASAAYLAKLHNGRRQIVASAGLHPHTLQTLRTYAHGFGGEVIEVPLSAGRTDPEAWAAAIDGETSAAIFAQPNFYGAVEDARSLRAAAKGACEGEVSGGGGGEDEVSGGGTGEGEVAGGGEGEVAGGGTDRGEGSANVPPPPRARGGGAPVVVAQVDPIVLGVLASPGECGVDVAVGEGQPLGNRLDYGGPSFGFFAAREEYLRRMPGRIAGETRDLEGRRGFVLTLQTREQHIRREKATSNICTAQALNALGGVVYLAWLGRRGIVELGELLLARTHYARAALASLDGVQPLHEQPAIREFALRLDADVAAVKRRCAALGVNPGVDSVHALTGRARGGPRRRLLVALTERRSRADIDRLAEVLGAAVAAECGAQAVSV